ncbi:MAG: hypothetical protein JKY09_08690 [Crocinitomicaceae bacterium]|nr:hypothetical protein [Crocinitomicaceae bacterium]
MNQDFESENKEQLEKAKKNLVYVGIFSVIMLFAGLTSAYIVSMGDTFWLKFPLPSAFWISTGIIIASSIVLQIAVYFAQKGKASELKLAVTVTLILGIGFVYFQFKGYGQLVDNGVHFTGSHIIVSEGKYGDYFEVEMNGKFIEVNGNDYLRGGQKMSNAEMEEFQSFMSQFLIVREDTSFKVKASQNFKLYFEDRAMFVQNNELYTADSVTMKYLDRARLKSLAVNVRDGRGDFFVKGEMGKDFHLYYKGKELQYKNRELQLNGTKLTSYLQIKAMESPDTGSSYLFLITFLHLLHIVVTLLFLGKIVIHSFLGKINSTANISIRMGAIFWHFLGLLWLYLLLFLLFIH